MLRMIISHKISKNNTQHLSTTMKILELEIDYSLKIHKAKVVILCSIRKLDQETHGITDELKYFIFVNKLLILNLTILYFLKLFNIYHILK